MGGVGKIITGIFFLLGVPSGTASESVVSKKSIAKSSRKNPWVAVGAVVFSILNEVKISARSVAVNYGRPHWGDQLLSGSPEECERNGTCGCIVGV